MIKDNQRRLNQFHIVLDGLVIAIAYLLSWYIFFESGLFPSATKSLNFPTSLYFSLLVVIVPGYLIIYAVFKLYTPKRVQGRRIEFWNIVKANTIALLFFSLALFLFKERAQDFSRKMLFLFYGINIVLETCERNLIRVALRYIRAKGYNQKHILLVGYSRAAQGYIDRILANPEWGYSIRGILDDRVERGTDYRGIRVIGTIENLEAILPMNRLDEIAITLQLEEYNKLQRIVAACEKSGVHTKFIPDYNNIIPTSPYTEDLLGLPVVHIRHVPLTNAFNAAVKRMVDIFGSLAAIIIFGPLMIITALIVKLSSPGPVIFTQERVGLHNRPFRMYKFRSMCVQSAAKEKKEWTTPNDPRVTTIGKFIRRTSIDEFPQFFNVLLGDMSLVGPRPERPFFVEKFKEEIPRYMVKHQVRPGLTGWAQVNGYRGDTSITKRIEHDLYYIENWTLGFDFKIIFLTIFKGFINKNAY